MRLTYPDLDSSFSHPLVQSIALLPYSLFSPPFIYSFIHLLTQEVHRGFPDAKFTPTHAVVATWENVAAYDEQTRISGPSPSDKVRCTEASFFRVNSPPISLFSVFWFS